MLSRDEVDALFPADLPEPAHWESRYPPRDLPPGAQVTRFSPSPTGFLHIGAVYVAMLDRAVAESTGGVYLVRIEDTDSAREVEGAAAQFERTFDHFGLQPTENGSYGPYQQSRRSEVYLTYVREFLRQGRAYPCFATREELAANAAEQTAAKVPTGYYGRWAPWRDAPADQVRARLAAGEPYVVRFRSPGVPARVSFTDLIRGRVETDDNRNDVVILKSGPVRLPTYHFAHAVDDHLMRVTVVIRGEEWLPSVPTHLQLFDAAGFARVPYAHIAPLMKLDGKAKRKLSKRKDPEANVEFYVAAGYPVDAVLYYLRGLANGRLAELPAPDALRAPVRLEECGVAGPLVDMAKLEDISADLIATMSGEDILAAVLIWAQSYDPALRDAVAAEPDLALRALAIERVGVANPRKDLRKWSDFRRVYGYFFFRPPFAAADLGGLDPRPLVSDLLAAYRHEEDLVDQVRAAAARNGFAASVKEYKASPESYVGSIREASQVVRVLLTGSTRSPALSAVAATLGEEEVRHRLGVALAP